MLTYESGSSSYRPDIDGLRALAILSVIGFHYLPDWVRGGFTGVDIFFVISGFLISGIVFHELENSTFSFQNFYFRRIRRIFPALILVLIVNLTVGWFATDPLESAYDLLSKHAAAAAGFVSNFLLRAEESSYFDIGSEKKPLLHLWSLGIEEQFYIIWPLISWLVWKVRRSFFFPLMLAIAILSFLGSVYVLQVNPKDAFYLPNLRFWELMAGCILSYISLNPPHWIQRYPNGQSWGGVLLVFLGLVLISRQRLFPGFWAILPVFGTVLFISAGSQSWINRYILGSLPLRWIGLISYPLYLWHWPVLFWMNQVYDTDPDLKNRLSKEIACWISILISFFLAWLTYRFVEMPIRSEKRSARPVAILCSSLIGIFIFGVFSYQTGFGDYRISRDFRSQMKILEKFKTDSKVAHEAVSGPGGRNACFINSYEKRSIKQFEENNCFEIKAPGKPVVFLIGDSHSASIGLGLRPFLKKRNVNLVQVSTGWCEATSNNYNSDEKWCQDLNNRVLLEIAKNKPAVVILNEHWVGASNPPYLVSGRLVDLLHEKLKILKSLGVGHIFVIGQMPTWSPSLPDVLIREFLAKSIPTPDHTSLGLEDYSLKKDNELKEIFPLDQVTFLSMVDFLCTKEGCLTKVGPSLERDILIWDYGHLTPAGANFVVDSLIGPAILKKLGPL